MTIKQYRCPFCGSIMEKNDRNYLMCKGKDRKVDALLICPIEDEGRYVDQEWFEDSLMYIVQLSVIDTIDDYEQSIRSVYNE